MITDEQLAVLVSLAENYNLQLDPERARDVLTELRDLRALKANVRRCPACHAERLTAPVWTLEVDPLREVDDEEPAPWAGESQE